MLGVVVDLPTCQEQDVTESADNERDVARQLDRASCVFAERPVRFRYDWGRQSKLATRVEWQLSIGDRTVSRGNVRPVFVAGTGNVDHIEFSLEMPPVKPDVVVTAVLGVTLHTDKSDSGTLKRSLFIFAESPFVGREQLFRELKIRLIDPNGATLEAFEKQGIPFEQVTTAAAIDALDSGLLIVGEGISWKDYSAAINAAQRFARRGNRVLCLAPSEGELALYLATAGEPEIVSKLVAARENVIRQFDKRFDTREWPGGPSAVSRFRLVSKNDALFARVAESSTAWPWVEMHFGDSATSDGDGGALIVCGLGIIKYWDDGPVPRYLLRAILNPLTINGE